tara:strand:+ start:8009 stop:8230 length:222 start_codon:yes stop_codon:yes gene_type:complete
MNKLFNPFLKLVFWIPIVAGGVTFLVLTILLRLIEGQGFEQLLRDWFFLSCVGWTFYFAVNAPAIVREFVRHR